MVEKYNLKLKLASIETNPKRHKSYSDGGINSKLIVEVNRRVVYETLVAYIDTTEIPIIRGEPIKVHSKLLASHGAPYYANEAVIFNKRLLMRNLIYQKIYLHADLGFSEFNLTDTIYDHLLKRLFPLDSLSISREKRYARENNLDTIRYLGMYKGKDLYLIIEIPLMNEVQNSFDPVYFLVSLDHSLTIKSIRQIEDEFDFNGVKFWSAYVFGFAVQEKDTSVLLYLTKGFDPTKFTKSDSNFFVLASYKLNDDDIYQFKKLYNNKLPAYYIDSGHFYRNTWPKLFLTDNEKGFIAFQYLNQLMELNGETIVLEGLSIESLQLPHRPSGKSNKPFEIIDFKIQDQQVFMLVWQKNQTLLYRYTIKGKLISSHVLCKSFTKPACTFDQKNIWVVNGTLKGKLHLMEFRLNEE